VLPSILQNANKKTATKTRITSNKSGSSEWPPALRQETPARRR
jgi:hypothetical protein